VLATSVAITTSVRQTMAKQAEVVEERLTARRHRAMDADDQRVEKVIEKLRARVIEKVAERPGVSHSNLIRLLSKDREAAVTAVIRAVAGGHIELRPGASGKGQAAYPVIK
jgi:hypothetical protein